MLDNPRLIDNGLRRLVRDLGPLWHRDRHALHAARSAGDPGGAVFYGDVARGLRIEVVLPDDAPELSADSLLMPRPDGGWEVFGDEGVVAEYDADVVRVLVRR